MLTNNNKVLAANYNLLESSVAQTSASNQTSGTNLQSYLQGVYVTLFVVVITSAIVYLVLFGIQYMSSTSFGVKKSAKDRLWMIVFGLAIALLSFIFLKLINPDLLEFKLLLRTDPTSASGASY